jgi:hypothetical protein
MNTQDAIKIARILNQSYESSPKKKHRDDRYNMFVDKYDRLVKQQEKQNVRSNGN